MWRRALGEKEGGGVEGGGEGRVKKCHCTYMHFIEIVCPSGGIYVRSHTSDVTQSYRATSQPSTTQTGTAAFTCLVADAPDEEYTYTEM